MSKDNGGNEGGRANETAPRRRQKGAFLDLYISCKALDHKFWKWDKFQNLTQTLGWFYEDREMAPETWSDDMVKQVKAFIDAYETKNPKDRVWFMRKAKALGDGYTNGREGWHEFVEITKKQVKVDNMVDRVLDDHGIMLDSLVEQRGRARQLDVISTVHMITFSEDTFGSQCMGTMTNGRRWLREPFAAFAATWERYRSKLRRDMRRFEKLKEKCKTSMEEIESGETSPTPAALKKVLKDITDLIPIMMWYKAAEVATVRDQYQRHVQKMLDCLDLVKAKASTLPWPLCMALQALAMKDTVMQVQSTLQRLISDMSPDSEDDNEQVELDFDAEQVVAVLGLPNGRIPFLNEKEDPDSRDPWSKEGKVVLEVETARPFNPRWHQYVGMLKMMHSTLNGKLTLLMDEVGVGKTLQAIMFTALREYTENIDNTSTIIICPPNLVNQWTGEIKRYLKHGEFDLIPYMGPQGLCETFWAELQAQCKHEPCHRIFLTTHTAVKADLEVCFNALNPYVPKITSRVFARHLANTIHGHVFGTIIIDKVHIAQNPKMTFTVINNLWQMSGGTVIMMMVTPLLTHPGDLWNLGHLMGVEGFGEEKLEDLKVMERDLSSALRQDRWRLKQLEQSNEVLDHIAHRQSVHAKLAYLSVVAEKMETLRDRFAGSIVRQMVNSLDFKGDPISGLPMYHEHIIQWPLLKWEQPFFDMVAHDLMVDDHLGTANQIFMGKQLVIDEDYILDERVAGLHPNKIIVYCAFLSNIPMIAPFLQEHNIEYLQVVGQGMSIKQRSVNLERFRKSGVDSLRVLLLSGVGMVGLNIADANILIIMRVHVYRLIVVGTPDIFLNNILFEKEYMQQAFNSASSTLCTLFAGREEDVQCSKAVIKLLDIIPRKSRKAKEGQVKGEGGAPKPKPKPHQTKKTASTVAAEQDAPVASGSGVRSVSATEVPLVSTSIQQSTQPTQPTPLAQAAPPTEDSPPTLSAQDPPPTPAQPTPIVDPANASPLTTLPGSHNGSPGPSTEDKHKGHPVNTGLSNPDKRHHCDETEAQLPDAIEDDEEPQDKEKNKKGKGKDKKGKGKDKKGLKGLPLPPAEKRNTRLSRHK
ncbi:hypothetical protein WOLCODRAFT_152760 [Wolfiporia cocos MD-104 SS10]|uniref:Helicase ATP-binding domain-containing protein n=1 Tax=Wolfiporia cocos (strain MD-104) TaxID=742152 RepID=A0A2H3K2T7_WOLCO|nr:hypothetical protein WOLCODRAFT_152760 [Wolfiporia cocos MD-104 SS10]